MWRWFAVLGLAACGDSIAAIDAAAPPDDQRGLVTIQVANGIGGGTRVFFQNADGSLVLATRTRNDGTANAFMAPGGFVTVVEDAFGVRLWTYAGVQPGDALVLETVSSPGVPITFRAELPVDPAASQHQLFLPCGGSQPITPPVSDVNAFVCAQGVSDVLVMTFDDNPLQRPLHFLYQRDVSLLLGTITLSGTYEAPPTSTVTVGNPPSETSAYDVNTSIGRPNALLSTASVTLDKSSGWSAALQVPTNPGVPTLTVLDAQPATNAVSSMHLIDWRPFSSTTFLDLAGHTLPTFVTQPTFDVLHRELAWTEGNGDRAPDAVIASIQYQRPEIGGLYAWTIIAPHSGPRVAFPVLPDRALDPQVGDVLSSVQLATVAISSGGYDQLRPLLMGRFQTRRWPTVGDAGQIFYRDLR